MVVAARIRAVITEVLRPAELVEKRLALIERQGGIANQRRLVEIVIATSPGKNVCAFGTDVGGLDRDVAGQLPLDSQVPLIAGRQTQCLWQNEGSHAVRQNRAAVRTFRLAVENGLRVERLRLLREREDREVILRRLVRLNAQSLQV